MLAVEPTSHPLDKYRRGYETHAWEQLGSDEILHRRAMTDVSRLWAQGKGQSLFCRWPWKLERDVHPTSGNRILWRIFLLTQTRALTMEEENETVGIIASVKYSPFSRRVVSLSLWAIPTVYLALYNRNWDRKGRIGGHEEQKRKKTCISLSPVYFHQPGKRKVGECDARWWQRQLTHMPIRDDDE